MWLMVWFPGTTYRCILGARWGQGSVIDSVASCYSIYWERAEDREVWLIVWFPATTYIGSVLGTGKCDWWCGFLVQHKLGGCWGQGTVIDGVVSWYSIYLERAEDREVWLMVWFHATAYIGSVLRTGKCDWWCGFLVLHKLGACWGQGSVIDGVVSCYSIYWERAEDREVWLIVWLPATAYIGSVLRTGKCDWWCGFLLQHILWACWGQRSVIDGVDSWFSIYWERAEDSEVWLMVWFPGTAYIGSVLRTGKCDWWCGFLVQHIMGACWG